MARTNFVTGVLLDAAEESRMSRVLRTAIVGLGHLHPRHYMPLFKMTGASRVEGVMEPDAALREPFCAEFGVKGYATLEAMLRDGHWDLAAIFLPHADCPAAAEACAAASTHVFVEKPMAASVDGAVRIVKAAAAHNVIAATGYAWRLHPAAREMKRLINDGVIGNVISLEGRCAAGRVQRYLDGHSPWILQKARSGGGPMFNLGVHWIDLFRWMMADEVTEVCGENVKVNTAYDIEDNSFAFLRFGRGAIASLNISYTVPDAFPNGRDLYVAVRGTRGVLSWSPAYEGAKDIVFVCTDHPDFAATPCRELSFELKKVAGYSGVMGWEMVNDLVTAILNGTPPAIPGEEGVAALRVVEAVYRSAAAKKWVAV
jgi:predicted dehydrogenase